MGDFGGVVEGTVKASAIIGGILAVAALLKILSYVPAALRMASNGEVPVEALSAIIIIATLASLPWWLPTG